MISAAKRVRACLICQGRLPAGSRIDRQYCGQACSDRAYYLRHPDKKRVLIARTRKAAESETRALHQAGEAARKLSQLEADNAALRRQLESAQKQIVDLKAAVSTAQSRSPAPDPTQAAALKVANQKIAALTDEIHQAINEVTEADEQLTEAHKEIAELKRQLGDAEFRLKESEQVVQSLAQRPRQPIQTAHAPVTQPVQPPWKPNATFVRPVANNDRPSSQTSSSNGSHLARVTRQDSTAPVREPLPWERPAARPGESPIPRWRGMSDDNFNELRAFSDDTLEALPSEIYKQGERTNSKNMRGWLTHPENDGPLRELSFRIILLTLCTARSQRRNGSQRSALAALVLDHAIKTMAIEVPAYAQEIKEVIDRELQRSFFERLTFELVDACRRKELLHNEQRGTWRFFVRAEDD